VLRIRDVYPESGFFHPGSRVKKVRYRLTKNLRIIVTKLSEI
jgi:hypothetical protein